MHFTEDLHADFLCPFQLNILSVYRATNNVLENYIYIWHFQFLRELKIWNSKCYTYKIFFKVWIKI